MSHTLHPLGLLVLTAVALLPDRAATPAQARLRLSSVRRHTVPVAETDPGVIAPGKVHGVVLIVIDTLRADHLSCMGSSPVQTHVIDGLARQGVLFTQAISQAPWTPPSVGSVMTARYPSVHGAGALERDPSSHRTFPTAGMSRDVPTLAQVLSRGGFSSAAFVTNAILSPSAGFDRGFRLFRGQDDFRSRFHNSVSHTSRRGRRVEVVHFGRRSSPSTNADHDEASTDRLAVESAAKWLRRYAEQPFFLWVHLMAVHDYERVRAMYRAPDGELRPLSYGRRMASECVDAGSVVTVAEEPRTGRADIADLRDRYAANVMFDDALVGVLIDAIRDAGVFDSTLTIILSDHGEELKEHGRIGHGHTLHDELLHVPLILVCPDRLPEGKVIPQQVRLIDVMPTVLDLVQLEPRSRLDGQSLLDLIDGDSHADRVAFSEFDERLVYQAVRTPTHKLIRGTTHGAHWLYDLVSDPGEQQDRSRVLLADRQTLTRLHASWHSCLSKPPVRSPSSADLMDSARAKLRALGYLEP